LPARDLDSFKMVALPARNFDSFKMFEPFIYASGFRFVFRHFLKRRAVCKVSWASRIWTHAM
jgi:hypothetical protein